MLKKVFNRFEEILGAFLLFIMVGIAFLNVLTRYFSNYSFAFTEEVALNFFVWITLLGISICYKRRTHLNVTLIYNQCPLKMQKILLHISNIFSIVFFSLLTYRGIFQVKDEYDLSAVTEALQTPTWLYTIALPVFSALIIFRILESMVRGKGKEVEAK
ncbi:MAG: TRAP transporter small permease [Synergistaceae bacterium]|jgi:TRAP-type C4-dicarboxylate transport system permease small subunit|nr:TRAP transporter small permease [Synergistaceae bacterium]